MNQEESKNLNSSGTVENLNTNHGNMLAGSPGIVIAPVSEGPMDASSSDKGRVAGGISGTVTSSSPTNAFPSNNSTSSTASSTPSFGSAPMINPTVVAPKVDVSAATSQGSTPDANQGVPAVSQTPAEPLEKPRKKKGLVLFLLLLIIAMGVYIYLDYRKDSARGECSPLVAGDTSLRELDVDSSIVLELYSKVKTTVREDLAYQTFDDTLKLYLAYRQIPHSEIYESNCNLFNENSMSNFTCSNATNFVPHAFSVDTLQKEVRKLFGESVHVPNQNIVLGNSCFGGYQYIEDRGEYVEGYCGQVPTTTYNADKELISATVQGDTIILKEKVRYYSAQASVPDSLQSGVYVYTFRLDNHYHYAYVSRVLEDAS